MLDDSVLLGQLAEEFSARVRQGQMPDLEEYAGRYPALAERIRALFNAEIDSPTSPVNVSALS